MLLEQNEILLLIFVAIGSYIQATTGFAFGLIVIGSVTALNLIPIEITAFLISVLSLVNSLIALRKGQWRHVDRHSLFWILLPCIPATYIGITLLAYLGENLWWWLKLTLGAFILISSLSMLIKKASYQASNKFSFILSGTFAGIIGGMFATFGPPITYIMYRQPSTLAVIRATLLTTFSITAIMRIISVVALESVAKSTIYLCLISMPIVVIATLLAQKYPPPCSTETIRKFSFLLLLSSGSMLIFTSLPYVIK